VANNITRWVSPDDNPPNLMLAIDPGAAIGRGQKKVPYCGAALFQWGTLVWAGLVKASATVTPFQRPRNLVDRTIEASGVWKCEHSLGEPLDMLAVEVPRIYKKMKSRPEDIVQLSVIAGAFLGGIPAKKVSAPRPGEWKGSIDKGIHLRRVIGERTDKGFVGGVLNSGEHIVLLKAEGGETDHVQDAIALGCWVAGRTDTGGVW
jgi:hypothetical protein